MTEIIDAAGLTKRFGKTDALQGLDLVAEAGSVTALLGPNGAGKTTFVRMLATLVRPDAGRLRVLGRDVVREPQAVRRLIGLAGQSAAVEPAMTGRENLELVGRLYGGSRKEARSGAQRVLEQLSLLGSPRLLLLDEPTTGLDPRSRIELWDAIRSLVGAGTDVLLTTQYLDEADRLADRIAIVDRGRTIAEGAPQELKHRVGGSVVEVHVHRHDQLAAAAQALDRLDGSPVQIDAEMRSVTAGAEHGNLAAALAELERAGIGVADVAFRQPTLDEVFLALTGRHSTDSAQQPSRADPAAA